MVNPKKIIMLRGLPASGKSTWARELLGNDPTFVRVNKDELREMLHDGRWSKHKENITWKAERDAASSALWAGFSVVVDDTNLRPADEESWRQFANSDATFEVKDFNTPLEVCVIRDGWRGQLRVGRGVIENMALRSGRVEWSGLPLVIVDIDGTLADLAHRQHFIDQTPKDYEGFHRPEELLADKPIRTTIEWVRALFLSDEFEIVLVSGRGEESAGVTADWLLAHGVPFDHIFMRRGGDRRPDTMIKLEILDAISKSRLAQFGDKAREIAFAIDDRPSIIKMWRDNGIKVYPVHQGQWEGRE